MSELGPGSDFLKNKYDLHNAPEVQRSAYFVAQEEETKLNSPQEKIDAYLKRLEGFFNDPDPQKRERKIHFLKTKLYDLLITKPEDISANYATFLEEVIEDRGQRGDWDNASDEEKQELILQQSEAALADQKDSLEQWIDYLGSTDATYPSWLKYWAFRSITGLAEYNKEQKKFPKRSRGTVKMFPDLNEEALSYVLDAVEKKYHGSSPDIPYDIQENEKARFQQFLQGENFANLYAWAIENINPIDQELLQKTDGRWVKYAQNSDQKPLVRSIQGKGTGWCTAGETTAKKQLEQGDFYVYYSNDQEENPTIPRIAIRMEGGKIAEVRGISYRQNLDPFIGEVLVDKLQEFPDKDEYLKKEHDMTRLTEIKKKTKSGEALDKDDLVFLYEIDSKIQGFGYRDDPRIKELRNARNPKEDAPIVLECQPEEIAWNSNEINENTKSYIGPLSADIFQLNLEHIYTTFPETEIRRGEVKTEGKSGPQYETELEDKQVNLYDGSKFMLNSREFTVSPAGDNIPTVRLKVSDLFSDNNTHSYSEILTRANELGLDFLPHEIGPDLLLNEETQPKMGEWYRVVSKPIPDPYGDPRVFLLARDSGGLRLLNDWARPVDGWFPDDGLMFGLRKLES